ncbi:MAG: hypothetical protein ACE5G9_07060 [Nitrospinales bacterium]
MTQDLITYWRRFFSDLLTGTFKRAFLFGSQGLLAGLLAAFAWKWVYADAFSTQWDGWLEGTLLFVIFGWYGMFGTVHGLAASFVSTVNRKFSEAVGGLHDLFDFLSRSVLRNIPKMNRTVSKEEMAQKFDDFGKTFLRDLRLRKGIVSWFAGMGFAVVLKAFKILFLNDVAEEVSGKPGREITPADIESAVRRVGMEAVLAPVTDFLLLMHAINFALMVTSFGIPFLLVWAFAP